MTTSQDEPCDGIHLENEARKASQNLSPLLERGDKEIWTELVQEAKTNGLQNVRGTRNHYPSISLRLFIYVILFAIT